MMYIFNLIHNFHSEIMTIDKTPEGVQYNFLRDAEDHVDIESHNIDYDSLVTLQEKKFIVGPPIAEESTEKNKFTEEFDGIVFYCKDCKKIVEAERLAPTKKQKVKFKCNECNSKNIFYGTKRGIEAYFHIGN